MDIHIECSLEVEGFMGVGSVVEGVVSINAR
jgi:hypothetical protein